MAEVNFESVAQAVVQGFVRDVLDAAGCAPAGETRAPVGMLEVLRSRASLIEARFTGDQVVLTYRLPVPVPVMTIRIEGEV